MYKAFNSNPSRWYSLVKKIGLQDVNSEFIKVECFNDAFDVDAANSVAAHFASISQEYKPLKWPFRKIEGCLDGQ